jgi:hypothetical protein
VANREEVQARPEREHEIALTQRLPRELVREASRDPQVIRISGEPVLGQQRRRHDGPDPFGQRKQHLLGVRAHGSATGDDHRTAARVDELHGAGEHLGIRVRPLRRRQVGRRRDVRPPGVHRRVLDVGRHVEDHRTVSERGVAKGQPHVLAQGADHRHRLEMTRRRQHERLLLEVLPVLAEVARGVAGDEHQP